MFKSSLFKRKPRIGRFLPTVLAGLFLLCTSNAHSADDVPSIMESSSFQKLVPNDNPAQSPYLAFGDNVSISGDRIAVSADTNFNSSGSEFLTNGTVFIYELNEEGVWVETAELNQFSVGNEQTFGFGRTLLLQGNRLVVGTANTDRDEDVILAFVYELTDEGWVETEQLRGVRVFRSPGSRIRLHENTIFLRGSSVQGFTVLTYELDEATGDWSGPTLVDADQAFGGEYRQFGQYFDIDGDFLFVSDIVESFDGVEFAGRVLVYRESTEGSWLPHVKLRAENPERADFFGSHFSVENGLFLSNGPETGSVIFENINGQWVNQGRLESGFGAGSVGNTTRYKQSENLVAAPNRGFSSSEFPLENRVFYRSDSGDFVHVANLDPIRFSTEPFEGDPVVLVDADDNGRFVTSGNNAIHIFDVDTSDDDGDGILNLIDPEDDRVFIDPTPLTVDDNIEVNEDSSITFDVLANDTNPLEGSLQITSIDDSELEGSAVIAEGGITYTPSTNFNGTSSFEYTVGNDSTSTSTATVFITVNSVNDAPVASDDTAETTEGVAVEINVLANDSDVEDELLAVTIASPTTNGVVSVDAAGVVTYQPDTGYSGSDSFIYTVSDSDGGSSDATVTVTVEALAIVEPVDNIDASTPVALNNYGSGFNATFDYVIRESDTLGGSVREWRVEISSSDSVEINNAWISSGYNAGVSLQGGEGSYTFTNEGKSYIDELQAGDVIAFSVQGTGTDFTGSELSLNFVSLTQTLPATGECTEFLPVSLPFAFDGAGEFCWLVSGSVSNINSWNTESVTINGEAFTNRWSNNLPVGPGGTYEIRYNGDVAWSHFEINGSN